MTRLMAGASYPSLADVRAFAASYPRFLASFLPAPARRGFLAAAKAGGKASTAGDPSGAREPALPATAAPGAASGLPPGPEADRWRRAARGESIPLVEWRLFKAWTGHLVESCTLVHAAVVGRSERAVLLPGVTGSGKTTLTLFLLARGFTYLSDDCAVLGPEPDLVWPTPGALHVKGGLAQELAQSPGSPLLAALPYPEGFYPRGDEAALCGFVRPELLPRPRARPWRVVAVLFLTPPRAPEEGGRPTGIARAPARASGGPVPVTLGKALADMVFHSFAHRPEQLARDFRLLGRLLRGVPVWRLDGRDLERAAAAVASLLG